MCTITKCVAVALCSTALLSGCAGTCGGYGCGYTTYSSSCGAPSCTVNTTVVSESYSCDGLYDCW